MIQKALVIKQMWPKESHEATKTIKFNRSSDEKMCDKHSCSTNVKWKNLKSADSKMTNFKGEVRPRTGHEIPVGRE